MIKRRQFVLVILCFALFFIYAGISTYRILVLSNANYGWSAKQKEGRMLVAQVRSDGPATVLRVDDEIVAINGEQIKNFFEGIEKIYQINVDESYRLLIQRNGERQEFILRTPPTPQLFSVVARIAILVIPVVFLITGFLVFLLKPNDKQALLLALMFGAFIAQVVNFMFTALPIWIIVLSVMARILSTFFWPLFFHFFLVFPADKSVQSPLLRRLPKLEYWLYLPSLLILSYNIIIYVLFAVAPERAISFAEHYSWYGISVATLMLVYIVGGLLSLLLNYRQANQLARRKLRVVVVGSIAGVLPILLLILAAVIFDLSKINVSWLQWVSLLAACTILLLPLSFAYAIVRHQVIPVSLIIRRGVRYLLVSHGFLFVEATVVFAVISFLMTGERVAVIDQLGSRADVVAGILASGLAVLGLRIINRRVLPIIDRRFFREAYNAQQILSELAHAMRKVTTIEQMLDLAVAKIQDALHIENVSIFLRDEVTGDYLCAISSTHMGSSIHIKSTVREASNNTLVLPHDAFVVKQLRESSLPLTVDFQDARERTRSLPDGDLTRELESETLLNVQAALLLPIIAKEELLGTISLGLRLADLPFSREDKQLLMSVAWQMAFAIENAKLIRCMAEELAEEQRLKQELAMATEVQRRLFPQCSPIISTLELTGICFPARGVGGDYYDFLLLDNGLVGIAVADVAGKGISAALLMSIVQASLRSQAHNSGSRVTDLVSSMNRLLHRSTSPSSYATFFYAQFEEHTRRLTYVNAGHNPPLLVRMSEPLKELSPLPQAIILASDKKAIAATMQRETSDEPIKPLNTGGLAIGLFERVSYEQETIDMQCGDLIVAYTDGVSEALSPTGEEFGETRLRSIIASSAHLSAEELRDKIIHNIHEWCRDAPQHDDMTLVIVKVK
ncbi:MAG: SpoIIE family protein phosphatase [Acidobacteriota bacterium]